jgi:hypothetical protein
VRSVARILTRGRDFLPVSMPIGYETRGYPCPRVELPSLLGGLESEDDAEPCHGFLVVFSSLWGRGLPPHGLRNTAPRGPRRTTTEATGSAERTRWTSSKRLETLAYYIRHGTSSRCDATTPEAFGPKASKWETWCFVCDRMPEGATSSLLPGKGPSSSLRF